MPSSTQHMLSSGRPEESPDIPWDPTVTTRLVMAWKLPVVRLCRLLRTSLLRVLVVVEQEYLGRHIHLLKKVFRPACSVCFCKMTAGIYPFRPRHQLYTITFSLFKCSIRMLISGCRQCIYRRQGVRFRRKNPSFRWQRAQLLSSKSASTKRVSGSGRRCS